MKRIAIEDPCDHNMLREHIPDDLAGEPCEGDTCPHRCSGGTRVLIEREALIKVIANRLEEVMQMSPLLMEAGAAVDVIFGVTE